MVLAIQDVGLLRFCSGFLSGRKYQHKSFFLVKELKIVTSYCRMLIYQDIIHQKSNSTKCSVTLQCFKTKQNKACVCIKGYCLRRKVGWKRWKWSSKIIMFRLQLSWHVGCVPHLSHLVPRLIFNVFPCRDTGWKVQILPSKKSAVTLRSKGGNRIKQAWEEDWMPEWSHSRKCPLRRQS